MLGQLGTPVFVTGCAIDPSKSVCHTGKLALKVKIYWLERVRAVRFRGGSVSACLPCTHKNLSVQCLVPMFKKLVEHGGTHSNLSSKEAKTVDPWGSQASQQPNW